MKNNNYKIEGNGLIKYPLLSINKPILEFEDTTIILIPNQLVPHIELILLEYDKACKKHPEFADSLLQAHAILSEEVGEVAKGILEHLNGSESLDHVKEETAQVAAVCLRMLELMKGMKDE